MKKYEFTEETTEHSGRALHRIRALKDFRDVKAGDIGGWIEKEDNLSQEGAAWVYDEAWVCDSARVCDAARVCDEAIVCGFATVCDSAMVCNSATVCDVATVGGVVCVRDAARVGGFATVKSYDDFISFFPIGSRFDTATFFKGKDGRIFVKCGCFLGTIKGFRKKVVKTHGNNKFAREYLAAADLAEIHIKGE